MTQEEAVAWQRAAYRRLILSFWGDIPPERWPESVRKVLGK